MKYCLIFLFFAIANALDEEFIDEFLERIQTIAAECSDETNATPDDIAELVARKLPPSTHEGKCMLFCIQRKLNMMKNNGALNRAGAVAALQPLKTADKELYEKILRIFVLCGMRAKILEDPCETATGLAICGQKEAESMGLEDALLT